MMNSTNNTTQNNNNDNTAANPNHKKTTLFPTPTGYHHQRKESKFLPTQGTTGVATNLQVNIEAYNASGDTLYTIPMSDVHYMPSGVQANESTKKLHLCPYYNAKEGGEASCPLAQGEGSSCDHIHASLDNAVVHDIHVNYLWKNPSNVKYERFSAGRTFRVAPPNEIVLLDIIPSHLVLKTKAFDGHNNNDSGKCAISHCAHYYFNRICNRGSRCCFVHAVSFTNSVAPSAAALTNIRFHNTKSQQIKDELAPEERKSFGRTQYLREFVSAAVVTARKQQQQEQESYSSSSLVAPKSATAPLATPAKQQHQISSHQSPSAPLSTNNKSKLAQAFNFAQQQQQQHASPNYKQQQGPSFRSPVTPPAFSMPIIEKVDNHHFASEVSSCSSRSAEEVDHVNNALFVDVHRVPSPVASISKFASIEKQQQQVKKPVRRINNPYSWTKTVVIF